MIVYFAGKYRKFKVYRISATSPHFPGMLYIDGAQDEKFKTVAAIKSHIDQIYENTKQRRKGPRSWPNR